MKTNICVIPARAGSKRIPGKNKKEFYGKPIIEYTIELLKEFPAFRERIFVSTDDVDIKDIAARCGVGIIHRPEELADDVTGTHEVVRHAIEYVQDREDCLVEVALCVYPTAGPFLLAWDLVNAWNQNSLRPCSAVIASRSDRLQDLGYFYIARREVWYQVPDLINYTTGIYPIPSERAIDINTPKDWNLACDMYAKREVFK